MKRLSFRLALLFGLLQVSWADLQRRPAHQLLRRPRDDTFHRLDSNQHSFPIHQHDGGSMAGLSGEELAVVLQLQANIQLLRYGKMGLDDLKALMQPKHDAMLRKRAAERAKRDLAESSEYIRQQLASAAAAAFEATGDAVPVNSLPPSSTAANAPEAYAFQNAIPISGAANTANTAGIDAWSSGQTANMPGVDFGFYINIRLGSAENGNGQYFPVQVDTASADFWVPSESCDSCGSHQRLGKTSSPSFTITQDQWQAEYSSANLFGGLQSTSSVLGLMCYDTLHMGNRALLNFRFGVASQVPADMGADAVPYLGVLGFGNSVLNPEMSYQGTEPFLSTLLRGGVIHNSTQIGIRLSADPGVGEISFGGVNPSKFKGDFTVMESVSKIGYWEAPIDSIACSGTSKTVTQRTAIFDTRTALLYAPKADIISIFSGIADAYFDLNIGLVIPCQVNLTLSFTFQGVPFTMGASDLVFAPLTGESAGVCGAAPCCLSTIQATSTAMLLADTQWILGAPFLKNVFLGLDYAAQVVGLAKVM